MEAKKVLFVSQEINPYLPESPLATPGREIPTAIQEQGYEVRTFMPRYGAINERRNQLHEVIRLSGINILIDDNDHPLIIKVATLQPSRLQVYFIDNDDYFKRHTTEGLETVTDPAENDERAMFFVRGVAETVKKLRWESAFINCQGWISALTPLYLKRIYADDPAFRNSKIIYSLHNDEFEGSLDPRMTEKLMQEGFTEEDLKALSDGATHEALTKLAIDFADGVVEGAPGVSSELIEYAKSKGKPVMPYPGEENVGSAYAAFYESL